jgi:hypothetical protein
VTKTERLRKLSQQCALLSRAIQRARDTPAEDERGEHMKAAVEALKNVGEHMGFLGAVNKCKARPPEEALMWGRGSEGCQP